ncbi:AI-2E family transporter [Stieleria marina]|uniref:Pheromone autoinducer 2 transporter n=1 Tax=Stieleria marina TaxID=1930275 RepID=A0A517NQ79_9BACT|nr:pheromone autoinducer 2 transporter [Planctomycetes bacterium K23_9]
MPLKPTLPTPSLGVANLQVSVGHDSIDSYRSFSNHNDKHFLANMTTTEAEQPRIIRTTMTVIGLVIATMLVLGLIVVARNILMLIFGAILIAVVVNRVAKVFGRLVPWDLKRVHRVGIVILFAILIVVGGAFGFTNSINDQVVKLTDRIDNSASRVLEAAKEQPIVQRLREEISLQSVMPSSGRSLGLVQTLFASTFGALTDVLILIILAAYFSISPKVYRTGCLRLVPVDWRTRLSDLFDESADSLWHWMLGRLLAMTIVGISFGIGLAVLGVPMPVELAIFAGLVTFVPNLGGIAAVIPAMLLASNEGSHTVAGVLALYLMIQFAESYLITPLVQQRQVNLPPAMVILSQVIAGLLFGVWGIMFATPLVALALLWIRKLYVEDYLESASAKTYGVVSGKVRNQH